MTRSGIHPVTVLLIGATLVTGFVFASCAAMVIICWLTEPPTFPGDPNIGAGLLTMAALLNLPVIIGWGIWLAVFAARQEEKRPATLNRP